MNVLTFTALIGAGSVAAGFLGALTGLGGGVVIVPLLTLVFGLDIRYAIGASLVSVIATSSGAAAAYVKEGFTNIRIGMFLEVATTFGALAGAFLSSRISGSDIAVIFGAVLLVSAFLSGRPQSEAGPSAESDPLAVWLRLDGSFPLTPSPSPLSTGARGVGAGPSPLSTGARGVGPDGLQSYHVRRVPLGFGIMFLAGILSGLLGIGSGAFKVLAMDQAMRIPFKVSTTTSNFMIGVTAAASAGIYLARGYIDPGLAMPVMLGVLLGALLGARVLGGARPRVLRTVFALVIVALGIEMIYNGLMGNF